MVPALGDSPSKPRLLLFVLLAALSGSCGKAAAPQPPASEAHFSNTALVKVSAGRGGEWLLLFETLQAEFLVTSPIRSAALVGAGARLIRTYPAPEGWTLVDAVPHPSGDVSVDRDEASGDEDAPVREERRSVARARGRHGAGGPRGAGEGIVELGRVEQEPDMRDANGSG